MANRQKFASKLRLGYCNRRTTSLSEHSHTVKQMRQKGLRFNPDHLARLEDIVGKAWVESQLAQYEIFRNTLSVPGLWSHRTPETSPIIPLLFQHLQAGRDEQPSPVGYWYGDPKHYLNQLVEGIFLFEDFWSALPNSEGLIRYCLTNASRFSGFVFELMVASHYKLDPSYEVQPSFFDPTAERGQPDILLKRNGDTTAIACRSRDPLTAFDISFDLFHYLFGCFARLTQDSGSSWHLHIDLRRRVQKERVDRIIQEVRTLMGSRITMPAPYRSPEWDFQLLSLPVPLGGVSKTDVQSLLASAPGMLFSEVGGFNYNSATHRWRQIAMCSVSGRRPLSTENCIEYIVNTAQDLASESSSSHALTIAIHLYMPIDLDQYLKPPTGQRLDQGLAPMFESHPNVQTVLVSSNRQFYEVLDSGARLIRTPVLEVLNPRLR